jgi:hypothetical protein
MYGILGRVLCCVNSKFQKSFTLSKSFAEAQCNARYTQVAVGRRRRRIPLVDLINVDTIMSPAFVLPVYSCNRASPVASSPLFTDRFWHLDHKFCDRAGWDDIYLNEFNRSSLPPLIPTNAWMDAELLHPLDDASDIDDEDDYEDHS